MTTTKTERVEIELPRDIIFAMRGLQKPEEVKKKLKIALAIFNTTNYVKGNSSPRIFMACHGARRLKRTIVFLSQIRAILIALNYQNTLHAFLINYVLLRSRPSAHLTADV